MSVIEIINKFLIRTENISLGYSEINFFDYQWLSKAQVGYSLDQNGNSLTGEKDGDWREGWIAIATDNLGDPIFFNINTPQITVYSAVNGEGDWNPVIIADSLNNFEHILLKIKMVANGVAPDELEDNPVKDKEKKDILTFIEENNPNADIEYWEVFFDEAI